MIRLVYHFGIRNFYNDTNNQVLCSLSYHFPSAGLLFLNCALPLQKNVWMNGDLEPNSPSRQSIQYVRGNQHTEMNKVFSKVASQATPKT